MQGGWASMTRMIRTIARSTDDTHRGATEIKCVCFPCQAILHTMRGKPTIKPTDHLRRVEGRSGRRPRINRKA